MNISKAGKNTPKSLSEGHKISGADIRMASEAYRKLSEQVSRAVASRLEEQNAMKVLVEADEYKRQEPYRMMKKAIDESRHSTDQRLNTKQDGRIILILNEDGLLYLKSRSALKVDFSQAPLRKKLLSVIKSRYTLTDKLLRSAGAKSKDSFYTAKGEINSRCKIGLKLKDDLIVGQRGSFRINPIYQIILSDA
jgi:hypothetical protein